MRSRLARALPLLGSIGVALSGPAAAQQAVPDPAPSVGGFPVRSAAASPVVPGQGMVAGLPITTSPPVSRPPAGTDGLGVQAASSSVAIVPAPAPADPPPLPAQRAAVSGRASAGAVPVPAVATVPRPTPAQQSLIDSGVATISVRPGVASIFPVSQGRVNRIVTPFQRAKVSTEASEGVEVRGGVVYVTPSSELPVSMFITEDGDESLALNVTLVPSRVPPAHLELTLPDGLIRTSARPVAAQATAEKFERGQPYVDMLRALMRGLALGRVPAGFELADRVPRGVSPPACSASPVRVDFSRVQYLAGNRVEVFVGVVRNPRPTPFEFIESWCGDAAVMAVALSPTPLVPPNGAAEIYIARRAASSEDDMIQRRPFTYR